MLTKQEILTWLQSDDKQELLEQADRVRKEHCGDEVYIRGIIEFSSYCVRHCLYCGLRSDNRKITRYRMSPEEVLQATEDIARDGVRTVVLQSGDDLAYSRDNICKLIGGIKQRWPDMAVTLSVGERPMDDYKVFRDKGADRYLLKHETVNTQLYQDLHPGEVLESRMERLMFLRSLGFQIGVGHIVGLPGQTLDDLVQDILFYQELQPDMLGIGPFIPHQDTPLKSVSSPEISLVLKCIALARIVTKNAHIPSVTALNTLDPEKGHFCALQSGANVVMLNYTPQQYQSSYSIYDGKQSVEMQQAVALFKRISRNASLARGDSLKR